MPTSDTEPADLPDREALERVVADTLDRLHVPESADRESVEMDAEEIVRNLLPHLAAQSEADGLDGSRWVEVSRGRAIDTPEFAQIHDRGEVRHFVRTAQSVTPRPEQGVKAEVATWLGEHPDEAGEMFRDAWLGEKPAPDQSGWDTTSRSARAHYTACALKFGDLLAAALDGEDGGEE